MSTAVTTSERTSPPSSKDALLDMLARVHSAHALPPDMRMLAQRFFYGVMGLLFPHFAERMGEQRDELAGELAALRRLLIQALAMSGGSDADRARWEATGEHLFARLGEIREALLRDAQAIYEGDPAVDSVDEVILAYPGFLAIGAHRIAHELHGRVKIFPRLITEVAHRATRIDIHPGARIGASFAVDHGTGIVVGETAELGARVRLYQGVTLGAVRVNRGLEHTKRHPTIGDDVVIYANATILGGGTVVGRGSRIGGNVWLTRSVPPYSLVMPTARIESVDNRSSVTDDLLEFNI